jgi:hypothetical protein
MVLAGPTASVRRQSSNLTRIAEARHASRSISSVKAIDLVRYGVSLLDSSSDPQEPTGGVTS